ncbi:hypothetical protein WICPIJ_003842 [Wickerhamomyces pijperi]|uniref:Peptidase S8/S53 domain-containing protein n=1 Tax=Wickerhamomyces pijperi TaxID=599730 RepID=A0A9P8Q726_WICPI|nr:hypothetical protein WICPIJ_003842 [Wickerhamomyces pijperi]
MKLYLFLTTLLPLAAIADAGYFVQLKKPSTLRTLLKNDDTVKAANHIRPYVDRIISFGNFEGFSGNFTKDVIKRLKLNPLVADIVPDYAVKINDFNEFETQFNAPRHLARLSRHEKLPTNSTPVNYYYDPKHQGKGVYAYIIDTGIYKEHPDLEGRAILGADFTSEGPSDKNGHGTHVAGIIGSKTFGVAKDVTLVEVKALDSLGQGSLTTVISALEFAVHHRKEHNVPGVANLSLGAVKNNILNQAIEAAVASGLVVVVAAGNANVDACITSPASSPRAITVGAIDDRSDNIAGFSNWGACVDVFASGVLVQSLSIDDHNIPLVLSGTSMSSPSITGLVSILLERGVKPDEIQDKLVDMSTVGVISESNFVKRRLTPNRVTFNGVKKSDDVFAETQGDDLDFSNYFKPDGMNEKSYDPQNIGGLNNKGTKRVIILKPKVEDERQIDSEEQAQKEAEPNVISVAPYGFKPISPLPQ